MKANYLLEIEIFDPQSRKVEILTICKDLCVLPQIGYIIILGNEFDRVENVLLDVDHGQTIVKLERRTITHIDPNFDFIIARYLERGWRRLNFYHADG